MSRHVYENIIEDSVPSQKMIRSNNDDKKEYFHSFVTLMNKDMWSLEQSLEKPLAKKKEKQSIRISLCPKTQTASSANVTCSDMRRCSKACWL
jgi:hypothetical protein